MITGIDKIREYIELPNYYKDGYIKEPVNSVNKKVRKI